ncbi:putative siderophore-interacting protein [Nocardia nova SH22a]|uniref:Putative siderophore-interacting protein n=1 Tax=Nocardia nova SH22a TaxID=1415166 RepID=W5T9K4_9NOCA|nr:siderophore-interacting protein [Nocardia nova]AHH15683.1 putative siderophore-interacting protein [Nocardia nova SH22a]
MGKGFNGIVLKAFGADDYRFTVTSTQRVSDKYLRIGFTGGGLLAAHPVHPTQWVRIWFAEDNGNLVQRGYTLVDPNPEADTFDIEFALHGGPASRWAENAAVGDILDATVMGSKFAVPEPIPSEFVIFGDSASLPAINSLLDAIGETPARVWLEWQHESEQSLPVRVGPKTEVTWVERVNYGQLLRQAADSVSCASDAFGWAACDAATTRAIGKSLKGKLPKGNVAVRGYWR